MKVQETDIPGVLLIEPSVYEDDRGCFMETFHESRYREAGLDARFAQDSYSRSRYGVLRGLHYQNPYPQGKLVWVIRGEVFDVAVDLRRDSPTFARWAGVRLHESEHRQLYIPPGFAHGFCVLSEVADVMYKCTELYRPEHERAIRWDDPDLAIQWPIRAPCLSDKDRHAMLFADAPRF